ncbi:Rieske 2Fe-2S domain-containing protein [Tritonibacter mobilis]|nr:Rieske 2Fe-2S domain-containing protein [Tritonibacter mobilis]
MADAWRSYSGAPEPGTAICALDDVPNDDTLCIALDGFPIILVRRNDAVRAFVNACPHQYLPLNHRGDRLISADKTVLRCTSHGAGFAADTGEGVEGLGIGQCLDPIPVRVNRLMVLIGATP